MVIILYVSWGRREQSFLHYLLLLKGEFLNFCMIAIKGPDTKIFLFPLEISILEYYILLIGECKIDGKTCFCLFETTVLKKILEKEKNGKN